VFTHAQLDPPDPTSLPTCAAVQINRKAAGTWMKATLIIHKKQYISQKAGAFGVAPGKGINC